VNISSAANIGSSAFENTGTNELAITLGNTAPELGATIFSNVARTVRVLTPRGAEGYVENWVAGLRGRGYVSGNFTDTTVRNNITVVLPRVTLIYAPDVPVLRLGSAVSLAAPRVVLAEDVSISGQGWEEKNNGTWENFIPPQRAFMDLNEKNVRYYVATDDGIMSYSNEVSVSVLSEYYREVTVRMWQSNDKYGWPNSAALRIEVNGITLKNVQLLFGESGSDTFMVRIGDTVNCYWVGGNSLDRECAFVVYYSDSPPSPAFNPSNGTTDTSNVLLFKRYAVPYPQAVGNGTWMGSFNVGILGGGVYINTPFLHEGTPFSLAAPVITGNSISITGQGWQISDNGSNGWTSFTPPATVSMDLNNKYLRYYESSEIDSNVVKISIIPVNPEITILMWDSAGNGWSYSSALNVTVNGANRSNIRLANGSSNSRTLNVNTGDAVGFYWQGSTDRESAFVVYYTAAPPFPEFDPSTGTTDNARVLLSKQYNSGTGGDGALMGWFTVGHGVFINTIYAPPSVLAGSAFPLPAVPGVTANGVTISARGWQIGNDNGWSNTIPSTAAREQNSRKLRYYVTTDKGTTYSNEVGIFVRTTRQITVAMYSKHPLGGWRVLLESAALRITINGTTHATVNPAVGEKTKLYRFSVESGDLVRFYWVGGNTVIDYNCAFIVYYTDVDPDPAYNSESGVFNYLYNAAYYHTFGTIGFAIGSGRLLGEVRAPYWPY